MRVSDLAGHNDRALAARPWRQPGWQPRPVTGHDPELHRLKREYPYFGYVDVEVTGVRPFVMFSNNDDVVAQVYFWFGPDAYESLSLRVWRRMCTEATVVLDVGAYTGLYTLVAAMANPAAELHAVEPSPDAFTRLINNLVVNRLGRRVHAHELAAAESSGEVALHGYQGQLSMSTGSSITTTKRKEVVWSRSVRTRRLDEFVAGGGGGLAIKVDAEEAESRVLAGMSGLLHERPRLLVEVAGAGELRACLEQVPGYTFAVLDDEVHGYTVGDDAVLELRDAVHRGEVTPDRRVLPPNVVLWPGSESELAAWLEPLAREGR